jgi:hypothetical protein
MIASPALGTRTTRRPPENVKLRCGENARREPAPDAAPFTDE